MAAKRVGLDVRIEAFRKAGLLRILKSEERDDALAALKNAHLARSIRRFPEGFVMVWARARVGRRMELLATVSGAEEELRINILWPLDSELWRERAFKRMFGRVLTSLVSKWFRVTLGKVPKTARAGVPELASALLSKLPTAAPAGDAAAQPFRWC